MTARRNQRGWTSPKQRADLADLLEELERRRLSDLDTCRTAWEDNGDPMALAVAVMHAKMPEWLADALIVLLVHDAEGNAPRAQHPLRSRWRARAAEMRDRHRATAVASAKHLKPDISWDLARSVGERLTHKRLDDLSAVTPSAMAKALKTVRTGLKNPGRYYLPPTTFRERVLAALDRQIATLKRAMQAKRE